MLELLGTWGVLWFIGALGVLFLAVQDFKTTFVSDWVVYALLSVGVLFRVLEGINGDWLPLLFGVIAFCIMGAIGLLCYYGKLFAGGDVWLLLALAWYLPGTTFPALGSSLGVFGLGLLGEGFVYLICWTFVLTARSPHTWWKEVRGQTTFGRRGIWSIVCILFFASFVLSLFWWVVVGTLLLFFFVLVVHTRAVERGCLHVRRTPEQLLEGDWLLAPVRVGTKVIPVRTEGVTREDIRLVRKARTAVMITQGVPFVPVIAFAYGLMVCGAVGGFDVLGWLERFFV